jgi:hypothetical protein
MGLAASSDADEVAEDRSKQASAVNRGALSAKPDVNST